MAKVVRESRLRERIDDLLTYLTTKWCSIPEQAAEWGDWDEDSRTDFILDWPVCEDRLNQMQRYAEQGVLTTAQRARYDALLRLVDRNRPMLEIMLQDCQ